MFPSDFAACHGPVRYTLLAAFCWVRQAEITDELVGLLVEPEAVNPCTTGGSPIKDQSTWE
jgi:hypothetical protein